MSNAVTTRLDADDKLSPALLKSQKTVQGFGGTLNNMGAGLMASAGPAAALAAVAAGAAAVGFACYKAGQQVYEFAKESSKLTKIQQDAERQLERVEKSMGSLGGWTSENIKRFASLRQELTTFGDETTLRAAANLATFGNIQGEVFKDGLIMAQDMAAFFGTDLFNEVTGLGKALNDPVRGLTALSRKGVSFTAEQSAMVKQLVESNQTLAAQQLILEELANQYGGQSLVAADDYFAKQQQLENAFGDFREEIGKVYVELMSKFLPAMQESQNLLWPAAQAAKETAEQVNALGLDIADAFGATELSGLDLLNEGLKNSVFLTGSVRKAFAEMKMYTDWMTTGSDWEDNLEAFQRKVREIDEESYQAFVRISERGPEGMAKQAEENAAKDAAEAAALAEKNRPNEFLRLGSNVGKGLLSGVTGVSKSLTDAIGGGMKESVWKMIESLPQEFKANVESVTKESPQQAASFVALEGMAKQIELAAAQTGNVEVEVAKKQLNAQERGVNLQMQALTVWNTINDSIRSINTGLAR